MASGTIQMGILGDATYIKQQLTDNTVFSGTIYLTRIGPFVQISGAGIKLVSDLAANSNRYSANLIPSNCRGNRDFPIATDLKDGCSMYVNGSGSLFFKSGANGLSKNTSIIVSGMYVVGSYGAS